MKRFFRGMQWLLSPLPLFFMPTTLSAQKVRYLYDDAGNRYMKSISKPSTRSFSRKEDRFVDEQTNGSWLGSKLYIQTSRNAITVILPDYSITDTYHCVISTVTGIIIKDDDLISSKTLFKIKSKARENYLICVTINEEKQTWKVAIE